jgi:hypothetical protein
MYSLINVVNMDECYRSMENAYYWMLSVKWRAFLIGAWLWKKNKTKLIENKTRL